MGSEVFVASPSATDVAAVRRVAPLVADLTMRCGPFEVPAGVVASIPTLEQEESEAAQVLREFLVEDPWHGMGSVQPGGWMLLARDEKSIVFGQRKGAVGLGKIVTMERAGGRFTARNMGGWQPRPPGWGGKVEAAYGCRVDGNKVVVDWTCGFAHGGPDRVCRRVELLEAVDAVHFLLVCEWNPAVEQPAEPFFGMLAGRSVSTTFELSDALGDRILYNDFVIPAQAVDVVTDVED